jgi:hypothetical protein
MMAQNLLTAWEYIRPEIIESPWDVFHIVSMKMLFSPLQ